MALEGGYGCRNPSGTAETPHRGRRLVRCNAGMPALGPAYVRKAIPASSLGAIDPRQRVLGRYNGARGHPTRADLAHTFSAVTRDRVLSRIYVGPDSSGT